MNHLNLSQYDILDAMGIPIWKERLPSSSLIVVDPKIKPLVFVLLHEKINHQDEAQLAIFQGMLKVLGLMNDEYCIAWPRTGTNEGQAASKINIEEIREEIEKCWPETVCVMGESLGRELQNLQRTLQFHLQVTYHPSELQQDPTKKRQAYRDLLDLKEKLEVFKW